MYRTFTNIYKILSLIGYKIRFIAFCNTYDLVSCFCVSVSAKGGESVTLHTKCKIQQGSDMNWMLNDIYRLVIVKNQNGGEIKYSNDERFKGRLKMNPETGDLTITNIRWIDTGVYRFEHSNIVGNPSCRIFKVCISGE